MVDPFRYFIRVRYGDCDAQHVVYNPKYGEYFDLAATEYLRTAFAPENAFSGIFEFQVVKLVVEWKRPATFDDVLEIRVIPKHFGNTSFTLAFELRIDGENEAIVTGETVNVHAERIDGRWQKIPIPQHIKDKLAKAPLGKMIDHAGRADV